MSTFKHGDYKDLAAKIDWWIEHPEEHSAQHAILAEHAKQYQLEKSMNYYIDMFESAIKDWKCDYNGKKKAKCENTKIINYYTK